jgi:UDP-N-acetylglucosamine 1-carboxyvinyltransferase
MDRLRIVGGRPLQGAVAIAGAKNAALPQIAASLLSPHPLMLSNLPSVSDVGNMLDLIRTHGADVRIEGSSAVINVCDVAMADTHYDTVRKMRATVLVLGPLLARVGYARVSLPGGCSIGARPIDLHINALVSLGARIDTTGGTISAEAADGLRGTRIVLASPSVGATETAMMAATSARGETEIINAAREPEVVDLAACLVAMGAEIEGAGTHRIMISGDARWRPAQHTLLPDRIEAGTYAIAAMITGGQIELTGARMEHLAAVAQALEAAGGRLWPGDRGLVIDGTGPLQAVDIRTEPYPGFPTDLQAQFMALMTQAPGASVIRETIFEGRFMHVPELNRLGADIGLQGSSAIVRGPSKLLGAQVMATDLRASVSLVLAALAANGETILHRMYHLDRGYEQLDIKLRRCGADIERIKE